MLQNLWGRPPGLRGTPSSRSPPVESRPCTRRWPTRASAADEGVRPTIYADVRLWENYVALTVRERSGAPMNSAIFFLSGSQSRPPPALSRRLAQKRLAEAHLHPRPEIANAESSIRIVEAMNRHPAGARPKPKRIRTLCVNPHPAASGAYMPQRKALRQGDHARLCRLIAER